MATFSSLVARQAFRLYPFRNGRGRIIQRTFLDRLRFAEERLEVDCAGGFRMTVFPNDLIGRSLFLTGEFDPTIVDVLRPFCASGGTFFDIGANIGYVSCALLNAVPGLKIIAVEPQPEVFEILRHNVNSVGGSRATVINAALSDKGGAARMKRNAGNSGAAHITEDGEADLEVPLLTVEQALQQAGAKRVDVIKIDVEGHEIPVIRALAGVLIRDHPRAIVFEHALDPFDPDGTIRAVFSAAGYAIFGIRKRLNGWGAETLATMQQKARYTNDYIAVPLASVDRLPGV